MKQSWWIVIILLFSVVAGQAAELAAPRKVEAAMAGFTKIVVKWTPVKGAVSYKVYRNEALAGTVSLAEYVDVGLKSGSVYFYKVVAVNADGESAGSKPLEIHTLKPSAGEDGAMIQQAVDGINPSAVTASNLLSIAQEGLKALKVMNVDLVSIDPVLLKKMIDREMELNNDVPPVKPPKAGPKVAAKGIESSPPPMPPMPPMPPEGAPPVPPHMQPPPGLPPNGKDKGGPAVAVQDDDKLSFEEYMAKYFKGHSILDLYIYEKLTDLAEMHWQAGKKKAALMLYEKSLSYMSDVEALTFTTVVRMAYINFAHITEKSTREEMSEALKKYEETLALYTKRFPNENDFYNIQLHRIAAHRYFQCFPRLLEYANYDSKILDKALAHLKAIQDVGGDDFTVKQQFVRYNGWKLGGVKVHLLNSEGEPTAGTLTVRDVTLKSSHETANNERVIEFNGQPVLLPVYHGHTYDFEAALPVSGGKPLLYSLSAVPHDYGRRVIYNCFKQPVSKRLSRANDPGEVVIAMARPNAPYNLKAKINGNKFDLSWDWAPPSATYQLKEFKVYCDGVDAGTSVKPTLAGLKAESAKVTYAYTVCACDAEGKLSPESPVLTVPEKAPEPVKPLDSAALPSDRKAMRPPDTASTNAAKTSTETAKSASKTPSKSASKASKSKTASNGFNRSNKL